MARDFTVDYLCETEIKFTGNYTLSKVTRDERFSETDIPRLESFSWSSVFFFQEDFRTEVENSLLWIRFVELG